MSTNDFRTTEQSPGANGSRGDVTMPLGIGEFGEDAAEAMPGSTAAPRKYKSGSLVLIVVICLAAAGLYSMRAMTRVSAATRAGSEFETIVEAFMKNLSPENQADHVSNIDSLIVRQDEMLEVLSNDYSNRQVALEDVQKNPFILPGDVPVVGPDTTGLSEDQIRAARRQAIQNAAAMLRLKSVIMADEPLANLSGTIVRVGETIQVESEGIDFRVVAITPETVTLMARDPKLDLMVESVLRLGQADTAPSAAKKPGSKPRR